MSWPPDRSLPTSWDLTQEGDPTGGVEQRIRKWWPGMIRGGAVAYEFGVAETLSPPAQRCPQRQEEREHEGSLPCVVGLSRRGPGMRWPAAVGAALRGQTAGSRDQSPSTAGDLMLVERKRPPPCACRVSEVGFRLGGRSDCQSRLLGPRQQRPRCPKREPVCEPRGRPH